MDAIQSQQAAAPLFNGQDQSNTATSNSVIGSDFETFLRMLTVQMQNQDPLNPIDSTDYAVQLATFSSVEQQVLTNDLLTALSGALTGGGLGTLGQLVGMEVRGSSKVMYSGTGDLELSVPTKAESDRRQLVVSDASGDVVARRELDLASDATSWDGLTNAGVAAPKGVYEFKVEHYQEGSLSGIDNAQAYGLVTEARVENGGTTLILEGGIATPSDDVTGVRQPNSA